MNTRRAANVQRNATRGPQAAILSSEAAERAGLPVGLKPTIRPVPRVMPHGTQTQPPIVASGLLTWGFGGAACRTRTDDLLITKTPSTPPQGTHQHPEHTSERSTHQTISADGTADSTRDSTPSKLCTSAGCILVDLRVFDRSSGHRPGTQPRCRPRTAA
jgi:hypothetical protein